MPDVSLGADDTFCLHAIDHYGNCVAIVRPSNSGHEFAYRTVRCGLVGMANPFDAAITLHFPMNFMLVHEATGTYAGSANLFGRYVVISHQGA